MDEKIQRTLTGFVLAIYWIYLLFYSDGIVLSITIGLISAVSLYEVFRTHSDLPWYLFGLLTVILQVGIFTDQAYVVPIIALLIIALFICGILDERLSVHDIYYLFVLITILILGFHALYALCHSYNRIMFYICLATFGSDTGAYLFGMLFGKNKLIPRISPKKTIEGAIGGVLFGSVLSFSFGLFMDVMSYTTNFGSDEILIITLVVSILLSITAQFGDLTFSYIKRNDGIKDFGNILPGHGGVLDRIDSLLFNCLIFQVLIFILRNMG